MYTNPYLFASEARIAESGALPQVFVAYGSDLRPMEARILFIVPASGGERDVWPLRTTPSPRTSMNLITGLGWTKVNYILSLKLAKGRWQQVQHELITKRCARRCVTSDLLLAC